jgi:hypothetical protein
MILFIVLAISPYDRTTWWAENIPVLHQIAMPLNDCLPIVCANLFPLRDRQKHRLKNAPSGQNYYAPQEMF